MGQAIVTVLVLIAVVVYAVFFALWNQEVVQVVGFQFGGQAYVQSMPIAFLPLLGLVVGAVVMALSLWAPWATIKRAAVTAQGQLALEKKRSNDRAKKADALSKQLKQLKAELAEGKGTQESTSTESASEQS
jgi:uncharacterized membrane protein YciS (DUF1049 family)